MEGMDKFNVSPEAASRFVLLCAITLRGEQEEGGGKND